MTCFDPARNYEVQLQQPENELDEIIMNGACRLMKQCVGKFDESLFMLGFQIYVQEYHKQSIKLCVEHLNRFGWHAIVAQSGSSRGQLLVRKPEHIMRDAKDKLQDWEELPGMLNSLSWRFAGLDTHIGYMLKDLATTGLSTEGLTKKAGGYRGEAGGKVIGRVRDDLNSLCDSAKEIQDCSAAKPVGDLSWAPAIPTSEESQAIHERERELSVLPEARALAQQCLSIARAVDKQPFEYGMISEGGNYVRNKCIELLQQCGLYAETGPELRLYFWRPDILVKNVEDIKLQLDVWLVDVQRSRGNAKQLETRLESLLSRCSTFGIAIHYFSTDLDIYTGEAGRAEVSKIHGRLDYVKNRATEILLRP